MRDRARQGFDFFVSRGYSPAASAGILGNFVQESGLNPGALNPGDGSDGSNSIGLGQWNSVRAQNLSRFAQANKLNPRDFETQLRFTDWELQNTHQGARKALLAAQNPTEAAAAFVTQFERPKGSNRGAEYAHGWGTRNAHANAIYGAFGERASQGQPPAQVPAQVQAAGLVELLDDPDVPTQGAQPVGFFVPEGRSQDDPMTLRGAEPPKVELLDDGPAPRLQPSQSAPAQGQRPRVRVSLPAVDEDPERAARVAQYEREARQGREGQGAVLSAVDTAVRGAARAVPFMDDIAAAGRYVTGGADSYQDALDRERAINRVDDADRPVTSYGTQIGAGLALPGGALASSGVRGAAAVGAGYGALYGAGQGDGVGDRANRAVTGGAVGGALGAGGSLALSGIGAAGRAVAERAGVPLGIARGAINPEQEAARRIAAAAERDVASPNAQPDAHLFAAAREAGQPVLPLDEGGETTRALARSAANTSTEAREALQGAVGARNAGQGERIADYVGRLTGTGGDVTATREALQAQARQANRPAYARAYAEGSGGLWDEALQDLTAAPAVQQAIAKASRTGANRAVVDGFRPLVSPFARNADGSYALRQAADGSVAYPSLQFWDHVKRNLDDAFTVAQRQGRNSEAADIDGLRKGLVGMLDERVPSFASARAGAAAAFGAQDALEAGQKFVTTTMATPDARRAVAKLSTPERELFADGFSSALIDRVRSLGDRRDVVNTIFGSPKAREHVEIAIGKERASKLEAFLRVENVMTQAGRAVTGNSTTARQLVELGLAGGAGAAGQGILTGDFSASNLGFGALLGNLARQGAIKVDARVAQRVGEMLASADPEALRKVTDQVARQPAFMRVIRGFEDWLSSNLPKVAQPQAGPVDVMGAARALQGPVASRAEDEQR